MNINLYENKNMIIDTSTKINLNKNIYKKV